MKIEINKKEFIDALKNVELKGKWSGTSGLSSKSLGSFIYFEIDDGKLTIINADESTVVVKHITIETEDEGAFCLDIDLLKKYMNKMSNTITINIGDVVTLTSEGKRATIPIVTQHPFLNRIDAFMQYTLPTYSEDLTNIPRVGNISPSCGIQLSGSDFIDAIESCEIVNNGVYRFDYYEEDDTSNAKLTISSAELNASYNETLTMLQDSGESATVLFSAPLHKFVNKKENINLFIGDDQPLILVTENGILFRANRMT